MQYSLLSRFQGGLVAAIIAEKLAIKGNLDFNNDYLGYSRGMLQLTKTLTEYPQLNTKTDSCLQSFLPTNQISVSIITALPLILLNHENFENLEQKIGEFGNIFNYDPQQVSEILIWAGFIALILQEKLKLPHCLEQIQQQLSHLGTPLVLELGQIQAYLDQSTSLKQLSNKISHLSNSSQNLAIAIYCFLRTPTNISLSVLSTLQTKQQQPLTMILTAVLAGVYNSDGGIPLGWRWSVANDYLVKQAYEQANYLFQLWSGFYNPKKPILADNLAIASPQVMQPRAIWDR